MPRRFRRCPSASLKIPWYVFLGGLSLLSGLSPAYAQSPATSPQSPQLEANQNVQKPDAKPTNQEIVSRDTPTTFKVRVNVVLVRVVVRDNNGKVITNLKKEDFQLADNRKPQTISSFSVETPGSRVPAVKCD